MTWWQGDVAVVGAGPAGATAARRLAEHGLRVALIEKAALPRYKTCGGGLIGKALGLLPRQAHAAVERSCRTAELNVLDKGMTFSATRSAPVVAMTMRADLDHALVRLAQSAGVELLSPCKVTGVREQADAVTLATSLGDVRCGYVIAADGAGSAVARLCNWPDGRTMAPALECEVRVNESDLDRFSAAARFDFGLTPHGYAWVFPKREHLSLGVVTMKPGRVDLNERIDAYMQALGISGVSSVERHGFVIPITPRRGPIARGRVLLTGDAAGLADPVTAEGISGALQSGALAADAVIEAGSHNNGAADRYTALLNQHVMPELKAARRLARLLYFWPRLRDAVLRRQGQRLCELMTDVVAGQRTLAGLTRNPMNYVKALRPWRRQ